MDDIVNSKNFRSFVTFDEDHGREEVSFSTYDIQVLYGKHDQGWTFKNIEDGFLIRSPEEWLVDLTDPYKIIFYDGVTTNLAYYNFLHDLIKKSSFDRFLKDVVKKYHLHDFSFHLINGPALETEIRISGLDRRVSRLKESLYTEIESNSLWQCYLEEAKKYLGPVREIKSCKVSIHDAPLEIKSFFFSLMDIYNPLNSFKGDPFNSVYIENLFDNVPEADVYIFIPWGCFHYISSFINKNNINKIMLWELHADRHQNHMNKYLTKDLQGKKVLIIDNSYTGSTLNMMAELVKKEGGQPEKLAVYPKSKLAVESSDYCLFADKVLKSSDIDLNDNDWVRKKYKEIFNH